MKKIILSTVVLSSILLSSGVYTQSFVEQSEVLKHIVDTADSSSASTDRFINQKRTSYPPLYFDDGLTKESKAILDTIIDKIEKSHTQSYTVTLIGYTSSTINPNETIKLNFWSSFWHSLGSSGQITEDESQNIINRNLKECVDYLTQRGISPKRIYTENRLGKEKLYTEAISDGRELNNRVSVAIYGIK
jgi:outer membrane protein OmpA-like peptidoglycan-associated protein